MRVVVTQVDMKSHSWTVRAQVAPRHVHLSNDEKISSFLRLRAVGLAGVRVGDATLQDHLVLRLMMRLPHVTTYREELNRGFTRHIFDVVAL